MPASEIFLVLANALRQEGDAESDGSDIVRLVAAVVGVIAIVCIFFLVYRFFFSRRRRQTNPRVSESGAPTENDYLMYAYLQTQPPSVARLHRLANADGLSARELNEAAPVKTFSKASNASEDNVCAVCLEEMEAGTKTRKMPCGHEFDAKYVLIPVTHFDCVLRNSEILTPLSFRYCFAVLASQSQMYRRMGLESEQMSSVQHPCRR